MNEENETDETENQLTEYQIESHTIEALAFDYSIYMRKNQRNSALSTVICMAKLFNETKLVNKLEKLYRNSNGFYFGMLEAIYFRDFFSGIYKVSKRYNQGYAMKEIYLSEIMVIIFKVEKEIRDAFFYLLNKYKFEVPLIPPSFSESQIQGMPML